MRHNVNDIVSRTVQELSDGVFRLINRIVGDREHAMDLTQNVFVNVLQEPLRVKDSSKLKPYILRSAYNTALNFRRDFSRRKAKLALHKEELTPPNPAQPDQLLESAEASSRLDHALASLAPRQREALALRFFSELTTTEIAVAMVISEGSVKVHIARGLRNLKKQLHSAQAKEKL
jgi:RNA polymerase sigma-70 factor (ECF subfamily)